MKKKLGYEKFAPTSGCHAAIHKRRSAVSFLVDQSVSRTYIAWGFTLIQLSYCSTFPTNFFLIQGSKLLYPNREFMLL
jgi:hypothetical protein